MNRRNFFATGAAACCAGSMRAAKAPAAGEALPLCLATYSVRKFTRAQCISMTKELGVKYVNVKSFHLPYETAPAELAAAVKEFSSAGLKIAGGGSVDLMKDSDDAMRSRFDYAKACGMPMIVVATRPALLPRIEKFAKQYNIKIAIHNHGPEDKEFPSPDVALKAVRNMDSRMGVCVDVGHTMRTGVDVVECIRMAGPRLYDVHVKDLRSLEDRKSQCAVGEGVAPTPAIFRQLLKMKYPYVVSLEYEAEAESPMPGMAKSFAYMRGLLAGLA